jgi:hypothetical protein
MTPNGTPTPTPTATSCDECVDVFALSLPKVVDPELFPPSREETFAKAAYTATISPSVT